MKKIKLTQDKFALVDDEDFEYINQWRWNASWTPSTKSFRARTSINGKKVYMHRLIMKNPDGLFIDHINHDTLDNRKENLRVVTNSQNLMNTNAYSNNKLGVKGVRKEGKRFRTEIRSGNKRISLGSFETLEQAYQAYRKAAKEQHGEFSN